MSLFIFLSVNKYAGLQITQSLQYRYLVLHSDTLWNYFSSQNAFDWSV